MALQGTGSSQSEWQPLVGEVKASLGAYQFVENNEFSWQSKVLLEHPKNEVGILPTAHMSKQQGYMDF